MPSARQREGEAGSPGEAALALVMARGVPFGWREVGMGIPEQRGTWEAVCLLLPGAWAPHMALSPSLAPSTAELQATWPPGRSSDSSSPRDLGTGCFLCRGGFPACPPLARFRVFAGVAPPPGGPP